MWGLLGLIIIGLIVWVGLVYFEGEEPQVDLDLSSPYIGKSHELSLSVSDAKSGLRKIWIGLIKGSKEVVLYQSDLPATGLLRKGEVHKKKIKVDVHPAEQGIDDGKAMLRLVVWDYSWRGWWKGNRVYIEREVIIDTKPPVIDVLSSMHNITQGGAGLVIYRISEQCPRAGVQVGDDFYPGYPAGIPDKSVQLALMALQYDQGPGTELVVTAEDPAGNSSRAGFYYHIRKKKFKKDILNISDGFLNRKMPEFKDEPSQKSDAAPIDKFIRINRKLRQENYSEIVKLTKATDNKFYWQGPFLRLPKSAPKAGFADHRTYKYKGQEIDRQVHLGVDLASLAHSPVPAANNGIVAFTGTIGIYGKTVLVDHGFGLFSMYSHLSRIDVEKGAAVARGDSLGLTGTTGLAGGDHLHFSILIQDTFVNPIEWWDRAWIKNNILTKLEEIGIRN